jgi:hypothetical protein
MPFLTGYGKRKEIRYGTVFPGANLTDFPKLFKITADSDIAAELSGGGGIAVTEADGTTQVPFGLYPSSVPASGDLILRAKFDLLTAANTGDVLGYIYYDAGQTTSEDKAGTVSNGYVLFMPLEEDPSGSAPQMYDWVSESNIGTSAGSMTSADSVVGQVGNGLRFDTAGQTVTGTSPSVPIHFTVSTWFKMSGTSFGVYYLFRVGASETPRMQTSASQQLSGYTYSGGDKNVGNPSATSDGVWYRGDLTLDGTTLRLYQNGVEVDTEPCGDSFNSGSGLKIGESPFTAGTLIQDEVSYSSVARSADWVAYAHQDDGSNTDTFTLGTEETEGGAVDYPRFRLFNKLVCKLRGLVNRI